MKKRSAVSKLIYLGIILSLLTLIAVSGCGTPETTAPETTDDSSPADISELQHGGTLRVGKTEDAIVLGNPSTMHRQSCAVFAAPAIEKLLYFDEAGDVLPGLAEDWEVDPDENTITLYLRQGVKFHDGEDFNADVVKWNFEKYMDQERGELLAVESMDVIDDHTIRLNLSEMDNMLLPNLANVTGLMISTKSYEENGEEWAEGNPVGTGPFEFVEWRRDERIVFERFDDYWQEGKPYLDGVEFEIIADPTVMKAAFQTGDLDVIIELTETVASELEAFDDVAISQTGLPMRLHGLFPSSKDPDSPYSEVEVRQAVWHAIDREAVSHAVGLGYWEPLNQAAVKDSWVYSPEVEGYPYDPERAKELLAEAGYPDGFDTTIYCLNLPPLPDVATVYQEFLSEVGIDAEIEIVDKGRFDVMIAGGGGWEDGLTILWSSVVPNELTIQSRLMSREVSDARLPSVYFPEEYHDILDDVIFAPDYDTMQERVPELMKIMTDEFALVPYMYATRGIAARYDYVQDDGLYSTLFSQWMPQDAWMEQ